MGRVLLIYCALVISLPAAVFQYAVPIKTLNGDRTVYLWVPPDAERIRGVLVAGTTLAERMCVQDPVVRQACTDEKLAIIYYKTGLSTLDAQDVLDALAKTSGYRELSIAPLFFMGHSAGGPKAKAQALAFADRCFGLMLYRGGVPGGDKPLPPGIPCLMMVGQFDEFGGVMRDEDGREGPWDRPFEAIMEYRRGDSANLASIVVEPGAGHFGWSARNAEYFALFLRKAAQARIPEWAMHGHAPVVCKPIDPQTGWLAARSIPSPSTLPPASAAAFKGDPQKAIWYFDEAHVRATEAYHADHFQKKDQFIRWRDRHTLDAGTRYFFTQVKWIGDGQRFQVHPAYMTEVPTPSSDGRGPRWLDAGEAAGQSKEPIRVKVVGGPIRAEGPSTFRIHFDELASAKDPMRATFMAFSEGDERYRYTELVGMLPRGFKGFTEGRVQALRFERIADTKARALPVKPLATSTAEQEVYFHIARGPARIIDGMVHLAEMPKRVRYPIEVEVVAFQFGRGVEPKVKTAVPLSQVFRITGP